MTMRPPDNNINNNLIYLVSVTTSLIYYFSPFSFDSEDNKKFGESIVASKFLFWFKVCKP